MVIKQILFASSLLLTSYYSFSQADTVQATIIGEEDIEADRLYNSGTEKLNQKNFKSAIDDFSAAIALRDSFPMAYLNRASAKMGLEQYSPAIEDINQSMNYGNKIGKVSWGINITVI